MKEKGNGAWGAPPASGLPDLGQVPFPNTEGWDGGGGRREGGGGVAAGQGRAVPEGRGDAQVLVPPQPCWYPWGSRWG